MTQNGTLEYTARAFDMDAKEAMRGHLDRALIELITNADDAFGDADGSIRVFIEETQGDFAFTAGVFDSATGLTLEEMIQAFTKLGGKASNLAKGGKSRGLLGRGAKDVAVFGKVSFSAIKNGKFSSIEIHNSAKWESKVEDAPATEEHYKFLHLEPGQSGLGAVIHILERTEIPKPNILANNLRNNAQLRDLITRRPVVLTDSRQLTASGKLVTSLPQGEEVLRKDFQIEGYEGVATLVIRRLAERQPGQPDETSANGLLIKSGMTIFQNTWFDLSGRPPARLLSGEVVAPQIVDQLRLELEDSYQGAVSLLTRNRDGLQKDHDLFVKLKKAVTGLSLPIFDELTKETQSNQTQGKELDSAFRKIGDVISPDLMQILKELDDEMPMISAAPGVGEFEAIPGLLVVEPGANLTISLRAIQALTSANLTVADLDAGSGLKFVDGTFGETYACEWTDHPRLDRKVTSCAFTAPDKEGTFRLKFNLGPQSSIVQVVVRQSKVKPTPPPWVLEFSPAKVTSAPKRGKNMVVRAPIEFAGEKVAIHASNLSVDSCPEQVTLAPNSEGTWVEAIVHVKTSSAVGELVLTAIASESDLSIAVGEIKVQESLQKQAPGPQFNIQLSGDPSPLSRFSIDLTEGIFNIYIFGAHRGFSKVFGDYSEEKMKFVHEDEPNSRAVLAEVISQAIAEVLVEIEFAKRPQGKWDASGTIARMKQHSEKLIGKLHNTLKHSETVAGTL
jgi:hypothetical protein